MQLPGLNFALKCNQTENVGQRFTLDSSSLELFDCLHKETISPPSGSYYSYECYRSRICGSKCSHRLFSLKLVKVVIQVIWRVSRVQDDKRRKTSRISAVGNPLLRTAGPSTTYGAAFFPARVPIIAFFVVSSLLKSHNTKTQQKFRVCDSICQFEYFISETLANWGMTAMRNISRTFARINI